MKPHWRPVEISQEKNSWEDQERMYVGHTVWFPGTQNTHVNVSKCGFTKSGRGGHLFWLHVLPSYTWNALKQSLGPVIPSGVLGKWEEVADTIPDI